MARGKTRQTGKLRCANYLRAKSNNGKIALRDAQVAAFMAVNHTVSSIIERVGNSLNAAERYWLETCYRTEKPTLK